MKRMLIITAALTALAGPALAADHQVQMLNKGADGVMVFEPAFVQAEVGDTVTFVPTDKSHDVASLPGMLPEGEAEFESKLRRAVSDLTLDKLILSEAAKGNFEPAAGHGGADPGRSRRAEL
nr:plastocyanin/azurin family copper-binding protein [Paracoccus mutanolyticus]